MFSEVCRRSAEAAAPNNFPTLLRLAGSHHLHRDAGWELEPRGLLRCTDQRDTCMTKHQSLKDSLVGQVSSILHGSHTQVALPSITNTARVIPFGSSVALVHQHYSCLLWPGGFVSSLQPTHTPVPKQATRGLGNSVACLHWATRCNRGTTWRQQAVHTGEVT